MNADGTATLTLSVYDKSGTTLLCKSVWEIVLVENATKMRGIMTSLVVVAGLPAETPAPILTMSAQRLVPNGRGK